jgi:hypothetical protein
VVIGNTRRGARSKYEKYAFACVTPLIAIPD